MLPAGSWQTKKASDIASFFYAFLKSVYFSKINLLISFQFFLNFNFVVGFN